MFRGLYTGSLKTKRKEAQTLGKIQENYLRKKVMSVTGFTADEITVEKIKGREYKVTMQAKGCKEKIVKDMKI